MEHLLDNEMMYSVIVPVYNAERTINQSVDSLLAQNYKNFEIILVDDGSSDSSPFICDEYTNIDKRIRVVHQKNSGVSAARNAGLNIAKGKWIAFVDSDDYVEQDYLIQIEGEDADLILCCFKDCYQLTNRKIVPHIYSRKVTLEEEELHCFLKKNISTVLFRPPWAKFYKRELIGNQLFMDDMKVGEDACFVMNYLSKVDKMALIPNGAYVFMIDNTPQNIKYGMSVSYAVQSLGYLCQAYKTVNKKFHIGTHGFISYLSSFKDMSREDWMKKPSRWYRNDTVHSFYSYVWRDLPLKQKLKYRVIRFLSLFR